MITARHALGDATAAKNHLSNGGPITSGLNVFQDFFSYAGGVYHHVTGSLAGGHCVLVIGYSEAEQCWIIKNSWGLGWGIGGFAKIAYADLMFNGQFFPMYGATGIQLPASGWQSPGGRLTTEPVVGSNKDGRLEAFARGTDNALWHCWQMTPGGTWSGWASRGVQFSGNPVAGRNLDGRIKVFMVANTGALLHAWQTAPNNGWSGWPSLGGVLTSELAVGNRADGRLAVMGRGTDGALWRISQVAPNTSWAAGPRWAG